MEVTEDKTKKKTFNGYINEIWKECMENTDKCLVVANKPPRKKDK